MKNKNAVIYAIAAAVFYALNVPCSKLLLDKVSPTFMAGLLYLGAGIGVGMLMSVVLCKSISRRKYCSDYHNKKCGDISSSQLLMEQNKRQERSDEWCDCIVSACFSSSQVFLRPDISEDAQSVCNKSKQECRQYVSEIRQFFANYHRYYH